MTTDFWEPRLADLTWPELRERLAQSDLVIVPVGATEQHGPHLPLSTDSINIEAVAIDAASGESALVAPTIAYGVSDNHQAFCGTIALRPETLVSLLVDIGESLFRHGLGRLLLLNGHGGNYDAMALAGHQLRLAHRETVIGLTDLASFVYDGYEPASGIIYHADEGETAHTLAVAPDKVHMDRAAREISEPFTNYYERYYARNGPMTGRVNYGVPPTETLTHSGVMGDATAATAAAGHRMHAVAVDGLRGIIRDVRSRPRPSQAPL